jgi:hypothetical protein
LFTVLAETGLKAMTGTSVTGLLMSTTGLSAIPAAGVAIFVWGVGMTAGTQAARRGLATLGAGLGIGAAHAHEHAGQGLKAVKMFIADRMNFGRSPIRHTEIAPSGAGTNLDHVMTDSRNQGRPVIVETLMSVDGWREFMQRAKEQQIRVVDLDSLDETRASRSARPFEDPAKAMAEIHKARSSSAIEPKIAEKIVDRIARSDFGIEAKAVLYKAVSNEMALTAAEIGESRAVRDGNARRAEVAINERDAASIGRLRENGEIEALLKESAWFQNGDRVVQVLQRSVNQIGVEKTLELLDSDPALQLRDDAQGQEGTTSASGRSVADLLSGEPEMTAMMRDYVSNLGAVRRNADEILTLRDRQAALETHMLAQEEALARVERKIARETALLDPMMQRQVLADSLKAVTEARETGVAQLEKKGVQTGEAEIAAVEQATAGGHSGAEQIALAFSHMATRIDARFSEAHPGPAQAVVRAVIDPAVAATRVTPEGSRPTLDDPPSREDTTERSAANRPARATLKGLVAAESEDLDAIVVKGFGGAPDQAQRSGGRDIRNRTRRRTEVGAEM